MLWMFLPDEWLILAIVGIGLALILGLVNRSTAFRILGMILLFALLSPIIEGVMGEFPPWISLVILAVVVLYLLRGVANLLIGSRASDEMVGSLAADFVKLIGKSLLLPFYFIRWIVRRGRSGV